MCWVPAFRNPRVVEELWSVGGGDSSGFALLLRKGEERPALAVTE